MKILAGVVLYNPDVTRLCENIEAICTQVDCLILVENGSKNLDYRLSLSKYENIVFIKNDKSMGIAYALNQILAYAYMNDYEWALTLDQDSVSSSNMISTYKRLATPQIGIIGCTIEDRNFAESIPNNIDNSYIEVDWVISSASFTNVKAWKDVRGFDTSMFIDWVDWDICKAMKDAGYVIIKTYETKLIHELANNTFWAPLFGKWRMVLNRPAFRYYYVYRNRIYMARKYKDISMRKQLTELFWQTLTCIRYEKHKIQNIKAFICGIYSGFRMPIIKNKLEDIDIKRYLDA